jgi:hypothetical protein
MTGRGEDGAFQSLNSSAGFMILFFIIFIVIANMQKLHLEINGPDVAENCGYCNPPDITGFKTLALFLSGEAIGQEQATTIINALTLS